MGLQRGGVGHDYLCFHWPGHDQGIHVHCPGHERGRILGAHRRRRLGHSERAADAVGRPEHQYAGLGGRGWTAAASGTATRYLVKTASTDAGTVPADCLTTTLTCTIGNLDSTKHYTFTVRGENFLGGTNATATTAVVPDQPGTPTAVTVTVPAVQSATVTWSPPASGGAVTSYTVSGTSPDTGTPPTDCTVAASDPLTCTFSSLTAGASYRFTVTATNDAGHVGAAPTAAVVTDKPDAPGSVTATLGNAPGKVTVTWTAPPAGRSRRTPWRRPRPTAVRLSRALHSDPTGRHAVQLHRSDAGRSLHLHRYRDERRRLHRRLADVRTGAGQAGCPGIPAVVLDNGPGHATVSWSAPASGGAVSSYAVTPVSTDGTIPTTCASLTSVTTTCSFTTLTPASSYTFTITATNAAGTSNVATTSAIVPNQPDLPSGLAVTLGGSPGTATVTWGAPAGAAVTSYTVTPVSTDGTIPAACTTATSISRTCTFTGLTTTAHYTFTVRATNSAGHPEVTTAPAVVPDMPGAPTNVLAALDTPPGTALVTWGTPAGGGSVATYTVSVTSPDSGALPAACPVTPPAALSCRFTGLDITKTYQFTVRATNASGFTEASPTTAVMPNKPGTPGNPAVALGNLPGKVTVTWSAPAGGAVSTYAVTPGSPNGGTTPADCASVPSGTLACSYTTLTPASSYTFTIAATNAAGTSAVATTSAIVPNLPDVPAGLTVTLTNNPGTATVTWDAPTGAAVTSYTVTPASPDGGTIPAACTTATTVSRTCTFTGLTTVASYTFAVRAINAAGFAENTTNPIVPNKPNAPGTPKGQVIAADTVRLNWIAPPSGGQVTAYTVTAYTIAAPTVPIASPACTAITVLTCDFGGLTKNNSYTFAVTAIGPGGTAAGANSTALTTAGPASRPRRRWPSRPPRGAGHLGRSGHDRPDHGLFDHVRPGPQRARPLHERARAVVRLRPSERRDDVPVQGGRQRDRGPLHRE